jgi:hypothetical protein
VKSVLADISILIEISILPDAVRHRNTCPLRAYLSLGVLSLAARRLCLR